MKAASRETSQQTQLAPAEDEALKRNTDCVYFLASPLTCKKGNDCEYRHSEEARMNPRDCWYWLNGNCLNPKCSYRHPPLDGLVGTPVATSVKSSFPPSLPPVSTQLAAANTYAYNPAKQGTPCYYFQKGGCLKGDRCPFMHGQQPIDHVALQPPAPKIATPVTEPQILKKPLWRLEKCNQQNNFPQENVIRPVEVPPQARPPLKAVAAPVENGFAAEKRIPPVSLDNELFRNKATNVPSIMSGNSQSSSHRGRPAQALDNRTFRNGKDTDEFLGESSPGFDVLVDDELLESEYYEKEDDFGRMTGHGGRHLNTVNEIDYGRSADYNHMARVDRETYSESRGYETHGSAQDRYARDQLRGSSDRISDRPYLPERRGLPRVESPEEADELDLRYRLSKQRRTNGSRSAVSPDSRGDFYRREDRVRHVEDQRYHGHTRRDSRYLPHDSSISNRLQGRISLPGRSSPDRHRNDSHLEKEMDRGRKWARLSPGRPPISYPSKPQDRIRRRAEDEFNTDGRSFRTPFSRRDDADNTLDFAAPKSLGELKKGAKMSDRSEEQQTRSIDTSSGDSKNPKMGKFESRQELEDYSSFEGPKPLREILKRKRKPATFEDGDGMAYGGEGDKRKTREGNSITVALEKRSDTPSSNTKEATNDLSSKEEARFSNANANGTVDDEEEEGLITEEVDGELSAQKESEFETEDMIMLDNAEDEEFETSDQRDAEFDYEQVEEDGNPEPEEEYLDDEDGDGDDFAKRIGVMFS